MPETMQGVGARLRMTGESGNDLIEDVPDLLDPLLHHLSCTLDGGDKTFLLKFVVNEGLEQLKRHLLRNSSSNAIAMRTHDDDRASGIIDVLPRRSAGTAPACLSAYQRAIFRLLVGAGDDPAAAAIVEQDVDSSGILFSFRIMMSGASSSRRRLRRLFLLITRQYIVEIGGGEPASLKGNERPQVRGGSTGMTSRTIHSACRRIHRTPRLQRAAAEFLPLGLGIGCCHLLAQFLRQPLDPWLARRSRMASSR